MTVGVRTTGHEWAAVRLSRRARRSARLLDYQLAGRRLPQFPVFRGRNRGRVRDVGSFLTGGWCHKSVLLALIAKFSSAAGTSPIAPQGATGRVLRLALPSAG